MKNYSKKDILKYTLSATALVVFLYLVSSIDKTVLEKIAIKLGPWGLILFFVVMICSHVFAPISGTPLYFVAIKVYGYETMLAVYYVTCMVSAALCFYIARRWGRRIVVKLVGKKSMDHIDQATTSHERTLLVTGRLLGYFFFDFISYMLGFTNVSFKNYMTYTAVVTLIPIALLYFVFRGLDFNTFEGLLVYCGSIVLTGIVFSIIFTRIIKSKKV